MSLNIKQTTIYDIGNPYPSLRQSQKCGGVKPVNGCVILIELGKPDHCRTIA